LVELLVVMVIVGVMAAIILPNFTTGSNGARLRTAARGVTQMARYARTMAVLNQNPMDMVISSDGTLRVERRGGEAVAASPPPDASPDADSTPEDDTTGGGWQGYELAALASEKKYDQITFRVMIDDTALEEDEVGSQLDTEAAADSGQADAGLAEAPVSETRIPFESNGRCLPFVVKVQVGGEDVTDEMTVTVNRFGTAQIRDDDE
jgi:Tfp pilus assembly protein FimT